MMAISPTTSPLIVAMDFADAEACLQMAKQLNPQHCRLKVGKELFTIAGPVLVEQLIDLNFDVFLDLKFHDIPNTVAKAITAAAGLGVWMVNVHASGGPAMLQAAKAALDEVKGHKPLLIAVTVLTSLSEQDLQMLGIDATPQAQVLRLANLAKSSGLDGVVCSAREAAQLKVEFGEDFTLVTPGIRPAGSESGDQQRIMTPQQALAAGSDYLVIGRPITQAENPLLTCEQILTDIGVTNL